MPVNAKPHDLIFPGINGKALSDLSLTAVMRRKGVDAVPHGRRSTFRDWTTERTSYRPDIAEMALAHAVASKVEAAYRRGDLLDKRRPMREDWATFCVKIKVKQGNVVALRKA